MVISLLTALYVRCVARSAMCWERNRVQPSQLRNTALDKCLQAKVAMLDLQLANANSAKAGLEARDSGLETDLQLAAQRGQALQEQLAEAQRQLLASQSAADARNSEVAGITQRLKDAEAAKAAASEQLSALQVR